MKTIELEIRDRCAWVLFRDPKNLNTVSQEYLNQLGSIVEKLHGDNNIRSAVFATDAKNYSVGLDLKDVTQGGTETLYQIGKKAGQVFHSISQLRVPTLALYCGHTVGGPIEMGVGCDFRFAADDTKISIPGVKIGIFNPALTTFHLPRLIGLARAKDLLLSGRTIDATTALDWGLVSEVHPRATLTQVGEAWAKQISELDSEALGVTKKLLNSAFDHDLNQFRETESKEFEYYFRRPEALELMRPFVKK